MKEDQSDSLAKILQMFFSYYGLDNNIILYWAVVWIAA
jgi:hypothetical protein